jgi:hypothetical protein
MTLYLIAALTILLHLAFAGARVTISLFALSLGATTFTVGVVMALFALVPMLIAVYAIVPLTTWGLLGTPSFDAWQPMILEAFRHLVYGWTLGTVYPLMLRPCTEPTDRPSEPIEAPA